MDYLITLISTKKHIARVLNPDKVDLRAGIYSFYTGGMLIEFKQCDVTISSNLNIRPVKFN